MKHYFSILLFSILLCHIGLLCFSACLYFVFIIIFRTEVFRTSVRETPQLFHFIFCLRSTNTLRVFRIETMWRLRENVVSALFRRRIHVECLWGPSRRLSFENFDSSFTLSLLLLITFSLADNINSGF